MLEKVKAVIEEKLNADGADITENTSFKEDLNADSLDLFEMVMCRLYFTGEQGLMDVSPFLHQK